MTHKHSFVEEQQTGHRFCQSCGKHDPPDSRCPDRPSRFWLYLRERLDVGRYCTCGQEMAVDAVARYDSKTGRVKGYVWAVACPRIDLSFHADGSWSGNGHANSGHRLYVDCPEPIWLDPLVREHIVAAADDFGWCHQIPSDVLSELQQKQIT